MKIEPTALQIFRYGKHALYDDGSVDVKDPPKNYVARHSFRTSALRRYYRYVPDVWVAISSYVRDENDPTIGFFAWIYGPRTILEVSNTPFDAKAGSMGDTEAPFFRVHDHSFNDDQLIGNTNFELSHEGWNQHD